MTEQKQTTQNRLRSQIYYQLHGEFYSLETANQEVDRLSATIAAEIDTLTRERDKARAEVEKWRKELTLCNKERFDAQTQLAEARAEVERLRPAAEAWEAGHGDTKLAAWETAFQLQAEHVEAWRDRDESYWLARFMEEVGELAGALVGNHIGPVEWELSQLAAIALNWLDMRARAAKEEG